MTDRYPEFIDRAPENIMTAEERTQYMKRRDTIKAQFKHYVDRDLALYQDWAQGMTYTRLSEKYGIYPTRCRDVVVKLVKWVRYKRNPNCLTDLERERKRSRDRRVMLKAHWRYLHNVLSPLPWWDMTVREERCLRAAGVLTKGDLMGLSKRDLMKIKGIGAVSAEGLHLASKYRWGVAQPDHPMIDEFIKYYQERKHR